MTETTETNPPKRRSGGGLSAMLLPELKAMAGGLAIKGAGGMRKSQLVDAIKAAQSGGQSNGSGKLSSQSDAAPAARDTSGTDDQKKSSQPDDNSAGGNRSQGSDNKADARSGNDDNANRSSSDQGRDRNRGDRSGNQDDGRNQGGGNDNRNQGDRSQGGGNDNRNDNRNQGDRSQGGGSNRDDDQGSRRNRRRRGRDRGGSDRGGSDRGGNDRGGSDRGGSGNYRDRSGRRDSVEPDMQVNEDDVLVPAAGILDVQDNYAFVRTSGYLPGPNDVYVSLSMVRKYGLRKGDAVTGTVRAAREGDRKEKFNPLVGLDTINGADLDSAKNRVEFSKLTPLYAADRLRLETESDIVITRVIDIVAPIGKGQRGLIVSPPKAGKTMVLQAIANAITTNNPEAHLMVVLVDERPEEVTDMQRTVKGEVIASTFDRPADDHTTVAELAIERAKRLVELGHDVVVLLDSITRLGRAYNIAAPASGRILSGGVDSSALYPPKRFFGAARNIEDGGSLTILATALIETGSKMDEVIFEEFKGTGNMELRLRREFADKRIFPAIDVVASGTRREELLMSKEEISIVWKLRRVLSGLDGQQALELLLERLKKSSSNMEFLMQVQKTMPTTGNGRDDD